MRADNFSACMDSTWVKVFNMKILSNLSKHFIKSLVFCIDKTPFSRKPRLKVKARQPPFFFFSKVSTFDYRIIIQWLNAEVRV
jgi:hypothetical protein